MNKRPIGSPALTRGMPEGGDSADLPALNFRWVVILAVPPAAFAVLAFFAFAPGGMNSDVLFQLEQAMGDRRFNDWHPVIQAFAWRALILVTGTPAALLATQTIGLALAAFGLAAYIYALTRRRGLSLLGLSLLVMPWLLTFVGVLWKDSQMMIALLVAVVAILWASRLPRAKWWLLILAMGLLLYGIMVRKNAIFAAAPLLWMWWRCAVAHTPWRDWGQALRLAWKPWVAWLGVCLAFGLVLVGTDRALHTVATITKTDQLSQIYLDDIAFTMTDEEINRGSMPPNLRQDLRIIRQACPLDGSTYVSDAYWRCYRPHAHPGYKALDDADAIAQLWREHLKQHPDRYLVYRAQLYGQFLFATDYQFQDGIKDNRYSLTRDNPGMYALAKAYIVNFGITYLSWFFTGWFWLFGSVVVLLAARWAGPVREWVWALGGSALIYLMGYFFIIPAFNFRYAYWAAAAVSVAAVLCTVAIVQRLLRQPCHVPNESEPLPEVRQ